jgi:hemolysin activation/secretion protein
MTQRDVKFLPLQRALLALAGAAAAGLLGARGAVAQTVPQNVPEQNPLNHIAPVTPPPLGAVPDFAPSGAEPALPNAAIPVRSVSIIGATAFSPAALNAATRGLAGQTVPLAKVEAARRALVDLYRGHGFVLTTVSLDIDAAGNVR